MRKKSELWENYETKSKLWDINTITRQKSQNYEVNSQLWEKNLNCEIYTHNYERKVRIMR